MEKSSTFNFITYIELLYEKVLEHLSGQHSAFDGVKLFIPGHLSKHEKNISVSYF